MITWPWVRQTPPFTIVTAIEVEEAIHRFLDAQWGGQLRDWRLMVVDTPLNDADYKLMSRTQLQGYLRSLPRHNYVIQYNDCDDAAYRFIVRLTEKWGVNSVGKVKDKNTAHYYNIVVLDDLTSVLVEPQTASIVLPDEVLYQCRVGLLEI
jgi:hypothetical protein